MIRENHSDSNKSGTKKEKYGYDIMTILSTAAAFLIVAAAASLAIVLVIKHNSANTEANSFTQQNGIPDSEQIIVANDEPETVPEETVSVINEPNLEDITLGSLTIVSDVNIRDNPDTDNSNVIKVAKATETYDYIGLADQGNWYIVLLEDGVRGYVYKGYVSVN
ncbi:MAG: SH3 domain-containing protein [Clostridiales bacterium]|nr:SH3 domain-containing protein [Clostridiales bacterium]